MSFTKFYITQKGTALLAKLQTGTSLEVTKAACGKGTLPSTTDITTVDALYDKVMDLAVQSITRSDNTAIAHIQFSNKDLTSGFKFKEIGLYADDPDDGEILYAYGNCGDDADTIPPGTTSLTEYIISMILSMSSSIDINITIDKSLIYASNNDFDAILASTGWFDKSGYFTQEIAVKGIKSDDRPIIDYIHPDGAFNKALEKGWSKIYKVKSDTDKLIFYSKESLNTNYNLQIKAVR